MARPRKYYTRGNLEHCIGYLFDIWGSQHKQFLSILYVPRADYYTVADDDFLLGDLDTPDTEGTRILFRGDLKEATIFASYHSTSAPELAL